MKYSIIIILSFYLLLACSRKKKPEQAEWAKDSTEITKLRKYINNPANSTTIQWIDSVYIELDTVKQGEILNLSWRFKNIGSKPLVFANATSSCECTSIDKPKKSIASKKRGNYQSNF